MIQIIEFRALIQIITGMRKWISNLNRQGKKGKDLTRNVAGSSIAFLKNDFHGFQYVKHLIEIC